MNNGNSGNNENKLNKANIVSLQFRPKIGQKQKNLEKVKELAEKNAHLNPDLILVPEFFNTGVSVPEFKKLAETEEKNETLEFLAEIAKEHNSYLLAGSIIETKDGKLYNTSRLLDRQGEQIAVYKKIHLFDSFGGNEDSYCTRGDEIVVADTDFGKIGMSVCFDIKFPNHHIELVKRGAEIIVEPAAWCTPNTMIAQTVQEWILMNRARALDNMVYFASSNLCGKVDSFLTACGHSMIVAPNGNVLSDAGEEEGAAAFQIDMELLRALREQFKIENLWNPCMYSQAK